MRAKFSHPVISPWFKERKANLRVKYPNGKTLYFAKTDGTGRIHYPNGKIAMVIEKGGVNKYRTRIWVNGPGEVDRNGLKHPAQLCALFDSLGCGVVYDDCMRKRLVYNQAEGIFLDSPNGVPIRWKWHNITYAGSMVTMNEEDEASALLPVSPQAIISSETGESKPLSEKETPKVSSPSTKSTKLSKSEIDFREKFEHRKYMNTSKIFPREVSPIKPIIVQLNPYICLRISNQPEISLNFFAMGQHTRLKIGVLYNPHDKLKVVEVDDTHAANEKVFCPFESFPARTKSMLRFKKTVERLRMGSCS